MFGFLRKQRNAEVADLIGTRIRLDYYDHNDAFADIFPKTGSIVRRLEAAGGIRDWYLLELDEPFEYEGLTNTHVLIRSRWVGNYVGHSEPTSVFVLLIRDFSNLEKQPIDVKDFYHVVWGEVHTLSNT